jgi:twinkle protein
VLLIDPWNELEHLKPPDMLLTDYIRTALMYLKRICRHYGVAVIVIAHPTKAVTERGGRTPSLADIEGSMNWYNKCDNGLIVEREAGGTKVISAKVREHGAGRVGTAYFHVDPNTGRFTPQLGAVTP